MGIFSWVVVGVIAGWLAGLIVKGKGFGLLGNIIIGVIGAIVGGWLAGVLFNLENTITGINFTTILVAFLGAAAILFVTSLFRRKR